MPRYLFETDDGTHNAAGDALDLDGPDEARHAVLASLPDMSREVMPDSGASWGYGHRRSGARVYSATLDWNTIAFTNTLRPQLSQFASTSARARG